MSIFNHFQHLELSPDQKNALSKLEVFLNSQAQVFILKGYAGSGKTTILKGLVGHLMANKKSFEVMAPTGRAAKILRDKTGQGVTIHKAIYNFTKLQSINKDSGDSAEHSFHYYFPINEVKNNESIIIVDEASMISSKESKHELFTFGTNVVLSDLLTYARLPTSSNKLIIVGDPAQLPPVGDNKSLGLDKHYFESLGLSVDETEMTDVLRQGNNLILQNGRELRVLLGQQKRSQFCFKYDDSSFVKSSPANFIEKFTELFPKPEIGDGVVISYSNAQCHHNNMAIRKKIFPGQKHVVTGDLLLINGNNYHTYGVELFNGDIAKVVDVNPEKESMSAPVYCDEGGKKVRKVVTLDFRKIVIRVPSHPNEIPCYIIDSLIHSINRDLSICEMKALYINFVMRFNEEQKIREQGGLITHKVGSEEFKTALKKDPFFNALKVKFGYAITCHKAQGGEWDKIFVDYYGRISLKNDPLRWCYTATTRGVNTVFAINAPYFGKLDKFKFSSIGNIGTLPNDALAFNGITASPFHTALDHPCKSKKYWEIVERIENTSYVIKNVETFNGYLERYTVEKDNVEIQIEAYHKSSGHFANPFKIVTNVDDSTQVELENIFNDYSESTYSILYTPDAEFLSDLYSKMQEACSELEIEITNIVKGKNNYVNYYLRTDSVCSYIQFYYNDKHQLTTAMPKTFNCTEDRKLEALILKLLNYASEGN